MKRKIAAALGVIVAMVIVALGVRLNRAVQAIPKSIRLPFSDISDGWTTPPLSAGEYCISVQYVGEGGHLEVPLNMILRDVASHKIVPTDHFLVGGRIHSAEAQDEVIVGLFHAIEGHRYTIETDPDQVKLLAQYHHRLKVGLTAAEREERLMRAWRGE